ncbi:MAG: hypothetical protein ACRD4M_14825 [Candidatus Acidiferrales bacterium]
MRTLLFLALAVTFFTTPNFAQDEPSDVHQTTTTPSGARFEIIQSELAAKWTFRLDRFAGRVFQLVKTKDGDYSWDEMKVVDRGTVSQPTRARYQLFASGIAAKFTFLIDTDTGKTWLLTTSKETLPDGTEQENNSWEPFPE